MNALQDIALSPVAIGFLDRPPAGVPRWNGGAVPAGCTFWRAARDGQTFYTVQADHYNCAVGAHTHGISQPAERAHELPETVGFMVGQGYLEMSEVAGIPVLSRAPEFIAYGPAGTDAFAADVIVIAAKPAAAMLLYEIALRAGAANALTSALGRPACAVLPLVKNSSAAALSLGCKGNRVFTGLPDEELYVCIPAGQWSAILDQAAALRDANAAMELHYREKKQQFPILN